MLLIVLFGPTLVVVVVLALRFVRAEQAYISACSRLGEGPRLANAMSLGDTMKAVDEDIRHQEKLKRAIMSGSITDTNLRTLLERRQRRYRQLAYGAAGAFAFVVPWYFVIRAATRGVPDIGRSDLAARSLFTLVLAIVCAVVVYQARESMRRRQPGLAVGLICSLVPLCAAAGIIWFN